MVDFFTRDDIDSVINLVNRYPEFADIYAEIAEFRTDPREVMSMFSEALAILDRNTERYMVEELNRRLNDAINTIDDRDKTIAEQGKNLDETTLKKDKLEAFLREKGYDPSEIYGEDPV